MADPPDIADRQATQGLPAMPGLQDILGLQGTLVFLDLEDSRDTVPLRRDTVLIRVLTASRSLV